LKREHLRDAEIVGGENLTEVTVRTGQHFDREMSDVFFEELDTRELSYTLGIHGGSHREMTGRMIAAIEGVILREAPDAVILYGDTNSTLAGAVAAAKLYIPIGHVEAGLRSFRPMPEQINRILADRVSRWLFFPTEAAVANLSRKGISAGVHNVGDVMYDAAISMRERSRKSTLNRCSFGPISGIFNWLLSIAPKIPILKKRSNEQLTICALPLRIRPSSSPAPADSQRCQSICDRIGRPQSDGTSGISGRDRPPRLLQSRSDSIPATSKRRLISLVNPA
jgi:hypothetical protein